MVSQPAVTVKPKGGFPARFPATIRLTFADDSGLLSRIRLKQGDFLRILVPREVRPGEKRTAILPDTVKKLAGLGAEVSVEAGIGGTVHLADDVYTEAGALVAGDLAAAMAEADLVVRLNKPPVDAVDGLKDGAIHISYLDPFREADLVTALARKGVTAICMELIPRTTIAQKMDALSSQANLAGYAAVIVAADRLEKILPMMTTPAGTISPARVFVIGAGVAGLQAIATARRLGARVEAFDTRPSAEEQVRSLGAKFVKIDLGETGETGQGYAKALTDEQLEIQRREMAKRCAAADVVVTCAQVFGRKAPILVTEAMIEGMSPGSVIVDCAVESGGNVAGVETDREVERNGVRIVGLANLPGEVALDASRMYASNVANLIEHFWDAEQKTLPIDLDNEILKGCVVTHGGEIVNESLRNRETG